MNVASPAARDPRAPAWTWICAGALGVLLAWRAGLLLLVPLPLFPDEAYYFGWSASLELGYYSKPPMVAWAIAAARGVCGDGEACIRAPALLAWTATSALVYLLGARLFDRRVGCHAALAFALMPAASMLSLVISTDAVLLLFWALACVALVRALDGGRMGGWLATGLAGGLGLLSKYTMVVFPASVALFLALDPARRRELVGPRFALACLLALACFVPNIVWNASHGFVSFTHTAEISHLDRALFHPGEMLQFLAGQLVVFGPLLFPALLLALAGVRGWWHDERQRLLACLCFTFLGAITAQALLARANLNWALPSYVAGSVMVCAWLLPRRRRWLAAALAVNLALGLAVHLIPVAASALNVELPARADLFARFRGWPEVGRQVRARLDAAPGAVLLGDDRKTLAEVIYYARATRYAVWNPGREVDDHYKLTADLRDANARAYLVVARHVTGERLARSFESVRELAPVAVRTHQDRTLDYRVFLATGFTGY